jgi:hypothetical protein
MSDDNLFEYDDLVEFIAEFILVYEAARLSPQVYINWYNNLSEEHKLLLLDVRSKQLEITMKVAKLEEEAKNFEKSILDEVNKIIKGD